MALCLTRRKILTLSGALATVSLLGCSRRDSVAKVTVVAAEQPPRHLLVVAHADDLLLGTPELDGSLRTGAPFLTVVTTSGEANHRDPAGDGSERNLPDYQDHTAARYHQLRAAYADMVLGDPDAPWQRTAHGQAELSRLAAAPQVQLLFLHLWAGARRSGHGSGHGNGDLLDLWNGAVSDYPTMVPAGSPVGGSHRYTRAGLIDTLAGLLDWFAPTEVTTIDPDLDFRPGNESHHDLGHHNEDSDDVGSDDGPSPAASAGHATRTATALFTLAALQSWWDSGGGGQARVGGYRGSYLRPGTGRSTTRWSGSTRWLQPDPDSGRLVSFGVRGGRAVCWRETAPGSTALAEPRRLGPDGQLLPHLTAVPGPDGTWHLFGLRATLDPDDPRRDVVTAQLALDDADEPEWLVLGNPHDSDDPQWRRGVGLPYADMDQAGRVHLFTRTFQKGLAKRIREADGQWGPWRDLGGPEIQDGLAVTGEAVLAAARDGLARWDSHGAVNLATPPLSAPPTTVVAGHGREIAFTRTAGNGRVLALWPRVAGDWAGPLLARELPGSDGRGQVAALALDTGGDTDLVALASRDTTGAVNLAAAAVTDLSTPVRWQRTDLPVAGLAPAAPSLALDTHQRLVVAADPPRLLRAGPDIAATLDRFRSR